MSRRPLLAALQRPAHSRSISKQARAFYQNKQVDLWAARPIQPLTLRQIVFFGRDLSEDRLVQSANYVRSEIPVRLAHRLKDLQNLPYAVVTNERMNEVYELYMNAFHAFRRYPVITDPTENDAFCVFLRSMLNQHMPIIPSLALGLLESAPHLAPVTLDALWTRMLRSRIGRRVLAEQHVAISASSASASRPGQGQVGVITTDLRVGDVVRKCAELARAKEGGGVQVEVEETQGEGAKGFAYIGEHLEYILFELLKNAMRFTMLHHPSNQPCPPVQATIASAPSEITIRISDRGGGLPPNSPSLYTLSSLLHRNAAQLEPLRRTRHLKGTVGEQMQMHPPQPPPPAHVSSVLDRNNEVPEHLGIGLPLSKIYADYFGGSLKLVSLDGWGTDVYLRLPRLGTNREEIEV